MAGRRRAIGVALACALGGGLGCNALDAPVEEGAVRFVPTDNRPVQQALVNLPPISGGTLTIAGTRALVADSDRDRIVVVDLATRQVAGTIALERGDEPGRVTVDGAGIAHVALRGSGALLTFDPLTASTLRRAPVCGSPRGVTFDAATDRVLVACAGGELVAVAAHTGAEAWRTQLEVDLRDVVVRGDHLLVSRFKNAEQLRVDKQGHLVSKSALSTIDHTTDGEAHHVFDPTFAWRSVPDANDSVVVVHQRAQRDEVVINIKPDPIVGGSSYGGGGSQFDFGPRCDGIVHSAVSVVLPDGSTRVSMPIPGVVLAVDAAASNQWIALAVAGPSDQGAPRPFTVAEGGDEDADDGFGFGGAPSRDAAFPNPGGGSSGVVLVSKSSLAVGSPSSSDSMTETFGCASTVSVIPMSDDSGVALKSEQVVAVAFTATGDLVYQTREPSTLNIVSASNLTTRGFGEAPRVSARIELGGDSVVDTGHDLFHRDSGGGIACASCHAEGGDDGHVWEFSDIGRRRTQAVNVGLEGTEPFHWDGDMSGLHEIMGTVFVNRMGGVRQSSARLGAMSQWVFEQSPPAAIRPADDASAMRGHDLFMDPDVGCDTCHSGSKFTDNTTVDVGTGELGQRFQVPSLVGIAYRAPFMHNGCAGTLRERFTKDDCSGGDQHGVTSRLTHSQIDDLVAYMETL